MVAGSKQRSEEITMANIGSFKKVNAELGHAERSVLFAK